MNTINLHSDHNTILVWFLKTFPELTKSMKNCSHNFDEIDGINPYHTCGDIFTHTMMVFKNSQIFSVDNPYTIWSAILHDIGKPLASERIEDRKRVRFVGHEGVSAFMSLDILNKTSMSTEEKIHIFKIIALHGSLFNYIKSDGEIKKDLNELYEGNSTLLRDIVLQVRNDSFGRFFNPEEVKDNDPLFTQLLPDHFERVVNSLGDTIYRGNKPHQLTILVGPPCSEKSTWISENVTDEIVVSRDKLVELVGKKYGQDNYSDAWKWLKMKEHQKIEKLEVDAELIKIVQTARREKKDVVIDMTNMSKKSRRKWLNQFEKDYNKKCVVFLKGYNQLLKCNEAREKKENKRISKYVTLNMLKTFTLPMYGEGFDEIEYKLIPERF